MIPFQQMSIRGRLAFALVGAALLALVVAGTTLVLYERVTLEQRAQQVMEPYAQLVAVGAEAAVVFEDSGRAREILDTLRSNPQIREAEIVLGDGRLLARYASGASAAPREPVLRPDGVYLADGVAELVQSLPNGARLRLVTGLEELSRQTQDALLVSSVGIVILLAAVTLGLLVFLQRTIVRPISTLDETVEQVRTRADYHRRVPTVGTDEVARLGRNFNTMMAAIEERENELQRLTAFQRALLDNVAYGIISTTPEGIVTSFNPAAERLLGYTADEVVGKLTPVSWHDPDEVARYAKGLSKELGEPVMPGFDVFAARPRRNLPEESEWTFIRRDGARVPVLLSVTALRDENGRITGYVGMTYALTERKQAEQEIRQLNQQLEQRVADRTAQLEAANRELETFAYSVSHDLRAPLRHIDGFLGMLKKRIAPVLDDQSLRYMATISGAALRMAALIDDLLSFSRMGRKEIAAMRFDLGALVQEVIHDFEPETRGRIVHWYVGRLPEIAGDRAMLRIALVNLISNALKFTRTRAETDIEIGCRAGSDAETIVFVRDNGVGFDMRYADKLFGVFQRLHGATEFEGTGIGLANVRRIVQRHGGRTWAEGKLDEGATFFFSLPKAVAA